MTPFLTHFFKSRDLLDECLTSGRNVSAEPAYAVCREARP